MLTDASNVLSTVTGLSSAKDRRGAEHELSAAMTDTRPKTAQMGRFALRARWRAIVLDRPDVLTSGDLLK